MRAVFAGDLDDEEVLAMLARWCAWAQRCRISQFVKLGRTTSTASPPRSNEASRTDAMRDSITR
nr:transposase [Rhodococcus sp. NCIMB 12038]